VEHYSLKQAGQIPVASGEATGCCVGSSSTRVAFSWARFPFPEPQAQPNKPQPAPALAPRGLAGRRRRARCKTLEKELALASSSPKFPPRRRSRSETELEDAADHRGGEPRLPAASSPHHRHPWPRQRLAYGPFSPPLRCVHVLCALLLLITDPTRLPLVVQSSRPARIRRAPPRSSRHGASLTPPAPSSLPPSPTARPTP